MPANILRTKLYIPSVRPAFVHRPVLVERLNAGLNCRLTLLSAPAGYGKSTLLSEWVHQSKAPAAWLSLEKADSTPSRFWTYFQAALQTIPGFQGCQPDENLEELVQIAQNPVRAGSPEAFLTRLVSEIADQAERFILVLDDLHLVTDPAIHGGLVFLLEHLPASPGGMHLAVSSRIDPPWPMARWRLRNEVNEVRARDMRFSHEETVQFLNQALQLRLSPRDVSALQDRTEGWIAGLQMAAISMRGRLNSQGPEGMSRFVLTFTGSNRYILDYLVEEVVSQQPAEIQDFLNKTSILEHLTAPLCDAILDQHDSQAVLDHVEKANLFLIPLDDGQRWYRYHHLFVELLRRRLRETQPGDIVKLHQRASEWYANHDFLSEAISHALMAGDILRVNEFVSGNALAMVDHTELFDVLRRFEEMPAIGKNTDHQIFSKPWLSVAYAWVKAYVDPSGGLDQILHQVEQGITEVEDALERQHLVNHANAIRAYVAWVKGESIKALKFTRDALRNLAEEDQNYDSARESYSAMIRAHLLNIQGLALNYLDNLPLAAQSFQAAILAGQRSGRYQEMIFAYANLAFVSFLQGRLHQAYTLCQHALHLVDELTHFPYRSPVLAHAYATLSMIQLEWNDLDAAFSSAWDGVTLAERWNQADALHFSLTCLSKTLCACGKLDDAFRVNHRAMQLALKVSSWFVRISACDEVWFNLVKGDIPFAEQKFSEVESLIEEELKGGGTYLVTKVTLFNAQGNYRGVLDALHGLTDGFEREAKVWTLLNLLPFKALALHALGQEEEALGVISHCLTLAEPEGFVRIFVERGTPMMKLLRIALSRGIETEYISRLLTAFNILVDSQSHKMPTSFKTQPVHQDADMIEPLSERELQVLRLLDSPRTSEEIARELFVSVSTVRTHVRNIYGKLNVHGRIEAIQKAREISLI
jgi:LuxR family transcriptional regulator, maltose regulon positive regulatory protein